MAHPGYPQNPPQMMGQQGPMGMHQGMHPGMQQGMPGGVGRPIRRGTSRAVPVVVSAGLAVGVFCGLLFGLGTGSSEAAPEPAKGNNVKTGEAAATPAAGTAPAGIGATAALPATGATKGSAASFAAGSKNPAALPSGGTGPTVAMAGSGAGSAQTIKTMKLTIEIEPADAKTAAKILVDGKEITGMSLDLPAEKKQVKVTVTAPGFHSIDQKVDIEGGDTKVSLTMVKRATGGTPSSPGFGGASSGGNHVPTAPPHLPKPKPNNGIIDI